MKKQKSSRCRDSDINHRNNNDSDVEINDCANKSVRVSKTTNKTNPNAIKSLKAFFKTIGIKTIKINQINGTKVGDIR